MLRDIEIIPKPKQKKHAPIYDIITTFDIETTRLTEKEHPAFIGPKGCNEQAVMYIWAFTFHNRFTVIGRTWEEFLEMLIKIRLKFADAVFITYVHNLSYEFQFLSGVYQFDKSEVFAMQPRKILTSKLYGAFEFRCSYIHSNMNLDTYTKKMKVEHTKQSGEDFDYNKKRYPWTELNENELYYLLCDTVGLAEAIETDLDIENDNLYSFPLTSTGYVRRDIKNAIYKNDIKKIRAILPEYRVYKLLSEAFRGGNTHANRFYADRVLENVKSADRSSAYPHAQMCEKFPIGKWFYLSKSSKFNLDDVIRRGRAVVFRCRFYDIRLKNPYEGMPYISLSSCRNVFNRTLDNGRVLSAEVLDTTLTDIDYDIIKNQYEWSEMRVYNLAYSKYGYLPQCIKDVIMDYYSRKTLLKGDEENELYYHKSKNKLNSIYGNSAQKPVREEFKYINNEFISEEIDEEQEYFISKQHAFMPYAWGVWTTAHARKELEKGIELARHALNDKGEEFDGIVYVDTDSVKYIGKIDFEKYNAEVRAKADEVGAVAKNSEGKPFYMGVFEDEKPYTKFATLGSKKYCYQYEDGKTHVTIAGVTKAKGGQELDIGDEYGKGVDRFCDLDHPFVFKKAGGIEALYQDDPTVKSVVIDGHELKITKNVVLRDSTYTLGVTEEYLRILSGFNPLGNWENPELLKGVF